MITHTSSIGPGGPLGPDPRRDRPVADPTTAVYARGDQLSTNQAAALRKALTDTPSVRSEEVARTTPMALDPNYPPLKIIERVAQLIARSQDPSEVAD